MTLESKPRKHSNDTPCPECLLDAIESQLKKWVN